MTVQVSKQMQEALKAAQDAEDLKKAQDPYLMGILAKSEPAPKAATDGKKIKITVYVRTNKVGSECTETFEVDANATDEQIDDVAADLWGNLYECGWRKSGFVTDEK
jgi:hypothetical protein